MRYAFAVVAALAFVAAQAAWWVGADLLDSERFAGAARDSLESEEVRSFVARAVADRAVARTPVEVPLDARARIAAEVMEVATSDAFADGFEDAVESLHRTLLTGDAATATVDLTAADPQVRGALARVDPRLAETLPADALGAVDLAEERLPDLAEVDEQASRARNVALLVGAMALTLGLLTTRRRSRVLVAAGVSLALGSLALGMAAEAFVDRFAARLGTPALRDAASAVVGELTQGLRLRAFVAAVAGTALAVAAWIRGRAVPARLV